VYLSTNPKGMSLGIGPCVMITPRYCGPFEIVEIIGPMSYKLAVLPTMKFHDVLHVSFPRRYMQDPRDVINLSIF